MPNTIIYTAPQCPHSANLKTFMKEIVEYCEKKGIYLILDDIYREYLPLLEGEK